MALEIIKCKKAISYYKAISYSFTVIQMCNEKTNMEIIVIFFFCTM